MLSERLTQQTSSPKRRFILAFCLLLLPSAAAAALGSGWQHPGAPAGEKQSRGATEVAAAGF